MSPLFSVPNPVPLLSLGLMPPPHDHYSDKCKYPG